RGQHLQRDGALEPGVEGPEHFAHAARADALFEAVGAEARAARQRGALHDRPILPVDGRRVNPLATTSVSAVLPSPSSAAAAPHASAPGRAPLPPSRSRSFLRTGR